MTLRSLIFVAALALMGVDASAASFLRQPVGARVASPGDALVEPFRPLNVVELDLDVARPARSRTREVAVLFGRTAESGVARVEGLMLLTRERRGLRVVGAALFTPCPQETHTFAEERDLDGDGSKEVVVSSRLAESGVERTTLSWWSWRRGALGMTRIHRSEVLYRDEGVGGARGPVEARREVRVAPPAPDGDGAARIVERTTRTDGERPRAPVVHELIYRLNPADGRFALESTRRVADDTRGDEVRPRGVAR